MTTISYVLLKAEGGEPIKGSFKTNNKLKEMYELIGCKYITSLVMIEDGWTIFVDDEGMMNHNRKKPNIHFENKVFGNALVVKENDEIEKFTEDEVNTALLKLKSKYRIGDQ